MKQLSIEQFKTKWADVEAAVDATEGIDHWCSGPDWALAVATGFAPRGKRLFLESEHGHGYAALGYYRRDKTIFLSGIEPLWGFACPIFGPNIEALTAELAHHLADRNDWAMLILPGLPPLPHPSSTTVAGGLSALGLVGFGEGITRRVARLSHGYDHWLAQRSSRFRRNLRQATARATERNLTIVDAADDVDLFHRILAIENRSWKGKDGSGMTSAEMSTMYRTLIDRLRRRQRLQAFVARVPSLGDEHEDVGYILGGIRNRRYRGLQISFVDGYDDLSIGNLLQDHQLRHLTEHELVDSYDMGMDFPYKQRWADEGHESVTLIVHRGPPTDQLR